MAKRHADKSQLGTESSWASQIGKNRAYEILILFQVFIYAPSTTFSRCVTDNPSREESKGGHPSMIRNVTLATILFSCLTAPMALGQSTFGDLRGVVRDPSGLPIPGAVVTVHSLDENSDRKVITGDDGAYMVANLKPGHYRLSAAKEGFRSSAIDVNLSARQSLLADMNLALANQHVTVTVSRAAEQINTENGTIGDTKVTSQIQELPLNYRAVSTSPLATLFLSPNVQYDSQGNLAMGSATANMVGYSVDGISTADIWKSSAAVNPYPSSEGIAELQVSAFDNSAQFSQISDVTFTTKAGTNAFHGSLFEYLQNDALDADVLNFNVKAPVRFSTFGGSLGGPVLIPKLYNGHDKTFFFVDYEGNRKRTSQPEQYLVPTAAERAGDLNGLSLPNNTLTDPFTGQRASHSQKTELFSCLFHVVSYIFLS
jgi:hypothetical protein